jgi:uncharacterized protein
MKRKLSKAGIESVECFLNQDNIAIAGVSRKAAKFGNTIFKELRSRGKNLFPIHPEMEFFEGVGCVKSIEALPPEVTALVLCTRPENIVGLVKQACEKGINHIWLQQGAQSDEAIDYARSRNVNIIHRECILMFADPVTSIHKFHRGINKLFGIYPK